MMAAAYLHCAAALPSWAGDVAMGAFVPGCTGKARQGHGQATAVVTRRRGGTSYYCRACDSWHNSTLPLSALAGLASARRAAKGRA